MGLRNLRAMLGRYGVICYRERRIFMAALKPTVARRKRKLATEPRHALNAICPYYTMFPLEYPVGVLRRRRREGSTRVLDPFCGRGTTLHAARSLGMSAWGIDVSPVAVAIARAKTAAATPQMALNLAKRILADDAAVEMTPEGEFWMMAYSQNVLQQVCRLRQALLGNESEAAALLRALCLGALHGPRPKNPAQSAYFSNQMPRTFASKPIYSVKYWRERKLIPPDLSALTVLTRRVQRLAASRLPTSRETLSQHRAKHVIAGDAGAATTFSKLRGRFDVVVTSPPYYGMNLYVQDQWLRNWFVGGTAEPNYQTTVQVSHHSVEEFTASLTQVWNNVGVVGKRGLHLHVRFGSVPSRHRQDPRLLLKNSLAQSRHNWEMVSVRSARTADQGRRGSRRG